MALIDWPYLLQSLQHMTPGQMAARYAVRGVQRALEIEIFHGFCLTPPDVRPIEEPDDGVAFGFVEPSRLRQEAQDPASGLTPEELNRALANGEECYGAFVDGVLACQLWFTRKSAHVFENVYVAFDPSYAYSRWAYTRPPFRGRHLQARTKLRAFWAYIQRGCVGALGLVSASNFASIRSTERVGSTRAGVLIATGSPLQRNLWASPQCARYDLRFELGPEPAERRRME